MFIKSRIQVTALTAGVELEYPVLKQNCYHSTQSYNNNSDRRPLNK